MPHFPSVSNCMCSLVIGIATTFLPVAHVEAAWSTTQFEVVQGEPGSLLDAFVEGLGFVDLDDETVTQVENYLAEVALEYQRLGFREPAIDDKSTGGYAWQIFLFDYDDGSSPAGYSVRCAGLKGKRYIRIDSSRVMQGGRIDPKFLEHLAHELFHAVQGSYDLFYNNCSLGDWIVEGTAEALGVDTLYKLRKIKPPEPRIQLGGRAYINPLRVADDDTARKDEGYWTSSLWRYIGEHVKASASGGRPGTRQIAADYRYLAELFERDLSGTAGTGTELDWLDEGLESITGIGLDRLYPNFVSTFSGYIPVRAGKQKNADVWRKWVYGECPKISLSNSRLSADVSRGLGKVTAGCFELDIAIPDWVDIALQVDGIDQEGLKSLSIGTADGTKVGKPVIVENPAKPGSFFGTLLFRVPTNTPQVFVISNVAEKASDTRHLTPRIHINVSSWKSNMTKSTAQAQPAAKKTPTGGTKPDPTARQTAKELEAGGDALSASVAGGATTRLRPQAPACTDAFVYLACGPQTTISLSLMPGSVGQLGYVTGTGGMLAQVMGTFKGMAAAGPASLGEDWMKAAETVKGMDAAAIHMVIPLIDYGYTGSFSNASISVSGAGDASYYAQGPRDGIPGGGIEFPLSGQVTIENYTPYNLKGSFSAQLVDVNSIPPFNSQDPVLEVDATISGSFNIVNPWQGDRRARIINDTKQVRADIQETFPGLAQMMEDAMNRAGNPPDGSGSGGAGSGFSSNPGRCDCSCNQAINPEPRCESACGSTYLACAGVKHEAPVKTEAQLAAEKAATDTLRDKFQEQLESLGFGEEALEIMLETFDNQHDENAKKMMIWSYGGEVE